MARGRLKKALDTASTAIIVVAAIVFIWTRLFPPQPPDPRDVDGERIDASRLTHVQGDSDVTVVTFTDFQCPYCGRYERDTFPLIRSELVERGLLRYAVLHYPLEALHPEALTASQAAECAAKQGMYWEMHDYLFHGLGSDALSSIHLLAGAASIGVDYTSFERCLDSSASEKVAADLAEGRRLGVSGTPTFFIGVTEPDGSTILYRRIPGLVTFDAFRSEIDLVRRMGQRGVVSRMFTPVASLFRR